MVLVLDRITGRKRNINAYQFDKNRFKVLPMSTKAPSGKDEIQTTKEDEMDLSIPSNRVTSVAKSDAGMREGHISSMHGGRVYKTGGPYIKTAPEAKPMVPLKGGRQKELSSEDIMKEIEKSFSEFSVSKAKGRVKGGMIGTIH